MISANIERRSERRPLQVNTLRLCIDSYGSDIRGRFYSRMCQDAVSFDNCGELLLRADMLFDERGYPQPFQEKRSFTKERKRCSYCACPEEFYPEEEILKQKGEFCTMDVTVWSRRRAGWQGSLLYPDGTFLSGFQSEMEMLEKLCSEFSERSSPGS